ncbi:MAG TPA: phytoene desaturase family protein [Candidatus Acidoferrum sp.]|nr:phytoene desaturase family protein [Candidatus Acidoferrum sp.]
MTKQALIIGAGPGGLASAILLAARGLKVKIVERLPIIGGRTSRIAADGYQFDLGPTFFLYPRVLEEIFHAAGTSLGAEIEMVRLNPQYRIQFGAGGNLDCTPDLPEMERQIAALSPRDAPGFRRFLDENRTKLARMEPCLESAFLGWQDLVQARLLKMLPMLRPHQSVDTYLKRFFTDDRVRLAFCFQSKYLGMSPFRCPSLFSILSFLEYEYGVFHPIGGSSALTAAMARVAKRLGVEICLDEPVEEILFAGKRAVGVRTSQGTHRADAVVVNADFARAMERLVPDHLRRRWTNRKLTKKKYSCSTFMMYLGIEGKFDLPHHTIHIAEDYAKNLADIEDRHVLSDDPSFYVQNACVTDPSLAPRGHSTLYVLAPVTHQHPNVDWAKERTPYRELLFRQIRKAGYDLDPGRIRYERVITPADWDSCYEIYRGATFNLAHSLDQMLHLRPHNRFEDLEGVYLVGGGTHPGSGLPVIFESARISSRLLLEDLGMNSKGPEAPQRKDATLASRAGEAATEAFETVSRLLNLKPAPIVNERATEPRLNP